MSILIDVLVSAPLLMAFVVAAFSFEKGNRVSVCVSTLRLQLTVIGSLIARMIDGLIDSYDELELTTTLLLDWQGGEK